MDAHIRSASEDDAEVLDAIYNHYVATSAVTFDVEPWTGSRRAEWIRQRIEAGERVLAAELDGSPIGFAWTSPFRPKAAYRSTAELSVYVAPRACGRGVGSTLLAHAIGELRAMERHAVVGGLTVPNPGSRAMLLRYGFRPVGVFHEVGFKLGRYWDVEWLELAL